MTAQTPYQKWYATHKQDLSDKRKQRYKDDPVYRQACLARKAKQTSAKKVEAVDPQYTHNLTQAAEALGVTLWTLRSWRSKGYIPEPHEHRKGLYFTTAQVGLMQQLKTYFDTLGKTTLTDAEKAQVEGITDLLHANWV